MEDSVENDRRKMTEHKWIPVGKQLWSREYKIFLLTILAGIDAWRDLPFSAAWRAVETHIFMDMGRVERAIDLDVCNT